MPERTCKQRMHRKVAPRVVVLGTGLYSACRCRDRPHSDDPGVDLNGGHATAHATHNEMLMEEPRAGRC